MNRTVVFFHAHPDDEALLTGGTIARLADEGHRVVLVVATEGEAGLASAGFGAGTGLGPTRRRELERSAEILGCSRLEVLGFADSGMDGSSSCDAFCRLPPEVPAGRLAGILADERAAALVSYDPAGGYGHPDHIQVNRVGRIAARSAEVPVLLEATVDRRSLQRTLRAIALFRPRSPEFDPARYEHLFADPATITHAVNVRGFVARKRAALEAHASQGSADGADRTIAWLLRLPSPLFRLALGTEWFTEVGTAPATGRAGHVLGSLGAYS